MNQNLQRVAIALVALAGLASVAFLRCNQQPKPPAPPVLTVPDLLVVVYESLDTPLPLYVHEVAQELRNSGLQVRLIDDDVTDGEGAPPVEVQAAIQLARDSGLPALVICRAHNCAAIPLPPTKEEFLLEVK